MSTTSTLKQGLLVGLVICVLAAACSNNDGRGEQPAASDTSIADNDTTTTTTQGVAEPTTTTTQGVAEPTSTAEAEPATTGDSDADITTTTTVDATDTTSDGDTHDGEVVVVPETDIGDSDEPTVVIPTETTTSATQPATTEATITTEPSTSAPSTTTAAAALAVTVAPSSTTTTTSVQLEVSQGVVCGKRLVKLDEFVTETDNGCRQADCLGGRNDQTGRCLNWWEWADTLDRECPTVDTSDGLGAMGTLVPSLEISPSTFPQMVAGSSWVADIQLVDNDNWDWHDGVAPTDGRKYFIMFLTAAGYPPKVGEEQKRTSQLFSTDDPEGSWRVPFSIHEKQPLDPAFGLGATPRGAGCWAVRFTRTG